jgi:hypothetical protein
MVMGQDKKLSAQTFAFVSLCFSAVPEGKVLLLSRKATDYDAIFPVNSAHPALYRRLGTSRIPGKGLEIQTGRFPGLDGASAG